MALKDGASRQAALRYRAVAYLCLCDASIQAPVVAPAIVKLYNLTPREMTALATLIENAGVPEVADILRLSDGTIKKPPEIDIPQERCLPPVRSDRAYRPRGKPVSKRVWDLVYNP